MVGKCCAIGVPIIVAVIAILLAAKKYVSDPAVAKSIVKRILPAGGVSDAIHDSLVIHDETFWSDVVLRQTVGFGESYMDGKWDSKGDLKEIFEFLIKNTSVGSKRHETFLVSDGMKFFDGIVRGMQKIPNMLFNMKTRETSQELVDTHYNAGNDMYEAMLGPTMSYTCAYWRDAKNLEEAQTAKFDLIRRKLQLQPGMRVVDLGMGWGTAAAYMHEHGKVDVTGVSLAKEQVFWADQHLKKPGLQFVHADFRDHCADPSNKGTYDRVYSIGMLEHVGNWNYEPFFQCIRELLKPDGLAVVHTIGELDYQEMDPFFDKYIFPGTNIPAMSWLSSAWERHLILEDQHNFGFDYSLTLKAWYDNYQVFKRETKNPKYSVRFHRMMEFYLKFCEVLFSTRLNQLWQFVFTPRGTFRQGIERQI